MSSQLQARRSDNRKTSFKPLTVRQTQVRHSILRQQHKCRGSGSQSDSTVLFVSEDEVDEEQNRDKAIVNDKVWTDGDMEIISADNVRFRAPSCFLLTASQVLRDASSINNTEGHKLEFVDQTLETAYVLRVVLGLAKEGYIDYVAAERNDFLQLPLEFAKVYDFLKKWECPMLLRVLRMNIIQELQKDCLDVPRTFLIAACGNETTTAIKIVKEWSFACWPHPQSEETSSMKYGTPGKSIWDPKHWGLEFATLCPSQFTWAFTRTRPFVAGVIHLAKIVDCLTFAGVGEEA